VGNLNPAAGSHATLTLRVRVGESGSACDSGAQWHQGTVRGAGPLSGSASALSGTASIRRARLPPVAGGGDRHWQDSGSSRRRLRFLQSPPIMIILQSPPIMSCTIMSSYHCPILGSGPHLRRDSPISALGLPCGLALHSHSVQRSLKGYYYLGTYYLGLSSAFSVRVQSQRQLLQRKL
jgi:hypothetical protein